ncbi:MAG: GIY-YIG nuclease family protein [Bacteroidetes bacterium]|nr:GIY-YIG nuclease family protein [Bacteroidota bacterium]
MDFVVYILFSDHLQKYYVGQTGDLEKRIENHNLGKSAFTATGIPWKLVHIFACSNRSEAIKLESSIKKRGIKRYLQDKHIL